MKNTLEKLHQSIWELRTRIESGEAGFSHRRDLTRFFHESRLFAERRARIPQEDRSFLLLQERESPCVFLLHGAGGSPEEMREIGDALFRRGCTVYAQRLPLEKVGEGDIDPERLRAANINRWSACLAETSIASEILLACFPETWVAGFSFGGTLALSLMREYPFHGGILVSPAVYPRPSLRYAGFRMLRRFFPGMARRRYPREATVLDLMERSRKGLEAVDAPLLVVQGTRDPVISRRGFDHLRRVLPGERYRFILLDSDRHVIVRGEDGREVARLAGDFMKRP